jgi:uncharacterized protein YndB with AHSA1/START domain/DNA-binding transcriptional ArsR family regulator
MQPLGCMFAMDDVFKALADPSRRQLLDSLNVRNGQSLRELCAGLDMARQSVSKHLAVLEAANLVTVLWDGRTKLHYLNAEPINAIAERWIHRYDRARVRTLAELKTALESEAMDDFVYTTYIRTTPERVWEAITDPAFARRYLGFALETGRWAPGERYVWEQDGLKIADGEQVILECQPPRRLAFTFHAFTPELGQVVGIPAETIARAAAEPRSRVTFDLEPRGDQVKLTVIHAGLGSAVHGLVSEGWPIKLSDLKSELERG